MVPIRSVPASLIRTLAALSLLAGSTAEGARHEAPIATGDPWLDRMAAYYEAHPELKDLPGSGWKPYNRIRWEHGITVVDGTRPEPGARWLAWREKMERFPGGEPQPRSAWFQLGPENLAGRMLALAFHPNDPNTIYGGAAGGGLWKTTDEGATWTPLGDDLPTMAVSGVALSLTNPDIVVIATGELPGGIVDGIAGVGILRSTDGGQTFAPTSLAFPLIQDHGFHIVEAGPNGTFLAGAVDGLWRSSDDGQTWTQVIVGGDYYDVKWKPGDPNTVFTVKGNDTAGNKVKISTDDGLTFENAGTGQPPAFEVGKSKIALTAANPQYVYALYTNKQGDGTTGLYRTTDGGATWTARNTTVNVGGAQGWYNLSLAADPNNAERVIAGGVRLYRSGDGGTTLSTVDSGSNPHVDHHDARYQPGSPNDVWVACDGGIWESTSDGASGSWVGKNQGLVTYQFYDICAAESDPIRMAGGTQDNGTDVRTGSNIWSQGLGGDGMVCNIDPTNRDIIYAESQFGELRKSTNGGSSWFDIDPPGEGLWVAPVDIDRNNPLHLYMGKAGNPGGIYRTTNGGTSWTQVHPLGARAVSISPANGAVVWALDAAALYTTDDGATWNNAPAFPFPTGGTLRILAHPTIPGGALCSFAGYVTTQAKVAYTSDFGATWSNVTGDLPSIPVRGLAIDPALPDHWYLGTDVAVWVSTNGGTNWLPYATGIPQAVIWDIEIQESARKLVAGTHGRGAWEVDLAPIGTSVPEIARSLEMMLDPPAPNPVRGQEVVLRWASKRAGPVTLDVYDVGGRLVTRVDERSNGDGIIRTSAWVLDAVPAGVYFAVLDAGGERLSRKVVVLD
jgi:photosystem II stability/assembly factor-like uncharacterized protein